MKKNQQFAQQLVLQFNNSHHVEVSLPGVSIRASSQERTVPLASTMKKPVMIKAAKAKAREAKPRKKTYTSSGTSKSKSTTTRTVTSTRSKKTTTTNLKKVARRTDDRRWKN